MTPVSSSTGFTSRSLPSVSCSSPNRKPPTRTVLAQSRRAVFFAAGSPPPAASPPAPPAKGSTPNRAPETSASFAPSRPAVPAPYSACPSVIQIALCITHGLASVVSREGLCGNVRARLQLCHWGGLSSLVGAGACPARRQPRHRSCRGARNPFAFVRILFSRAVRARDSIRPQFRQRNEGPLRAGFSDCHTVSAAPPEATPFRH